ncbi:uncharacterized protein LOC134550534 [Prinia subflava]|uniref:uncharacterized protein LOC134550534 n=1 Tax=Prinia subflava TaxID=208062 RepID=UPI002FDFE6D6
MEKLKGLKEVLGSNNASIPSSSPLGCLLAHWKEGNFGQELRKDKLIEYCNVHWPKYALPENQRWPKNGSFDVKVIMQLRLLCTQDGRVEQLPYIDLFLCLLEKPVLWLDKMKAMKLENNKCLACVQNKHCMEHAVLSEILGGKRDELESELLVSPMAPGTTTAPSTPSSTPLTLTPPDSLTHPSLAPAQYVSPPPLSADPPLPVPAAPPLALPAQVPVPPPLAQRTPPSPHTPAQSYPAPPPTPAERFIPPLTPAQGYPPLPPTPPSPASGPSAPLYPPLPDSPVQDVIVRQKQRGNVKKTDRMESSDSEADELDAPVAHRTRGKLALEWPQAGKGILKSGKQKRTIIAPLRQGVGTNGPVFVKVPFSPADLVIWKQSAGTYRENPDKVARVVKMIMKTQNPDWEDIHVILDTLMDETERDMVLRAARERAREDIRNGLVTGTLDYNFPTADPEWDANDPSGVDMLRLKRYQEWISVGVQQAIPKSMNWSKLYEIRQEKKESPTAFLERLKEAARRYTDLQVDSEQGRTQLAFIFLGQAQEDIRKKLQKLEGEELRNLDKLLEVAWKVYNNRDREIVKKQGQSLLAVLQRQGRGRGRGGRGVNRGGFGRGSGHGRLGLNQCAYCRMEGHWKRECPNRFSQNGQPQLDSMFNQSGEHQLDGVARVMVLHEREPGSREPMVTLHLEGKDVDFLIDTGATHSVLNYLEGQIGNKSAAVIGATGKEEVRPFLQPLELSFEDKILTHEFLYMPDCPTPLLGRDLLAALEAVITFENGELVMKIPESKTGKILMIKEKPISNIPKEVEDAVIPSVWETDVPGKSKLAQPVHVELKEGAKAVRIKQYPIKPEARQGIAKTIDKFLKYRILEECKSEYNTPIFPVKKPNGEYRLVQDLRGINEITKDIHPVVANPYTLLASIKEIYKWFTVIDLKDAFFCIPLDQESRKLFAFEWEHPESGRKTQLTWSRLPMGYKGSPTLFGSQLAKELEIWTREGQVPRDQYLLLQYVDDILIATEEEMTCIKVTIEILNSLGMGGYKVSREKAQIAQQTVIYLGCEISQGQRKLGTNRIQAICAIPEPQNLHELRIFLGMTGWCRLWIMDYGLIAKPLYEAQKTQPFTWGKPQKEAFQKLKEALTTAPALGLPDLSKDFQLYVHERQRLALGVLTQRLGSWKRPLYF